MNYAMSLDDALFQLTVRPGSSGLPSLPPESIQKKYTSLSGAETFVNAITTLRSVSSALQPLMGANWEPARILDFGCGWGRFSQIFRLLYPTQAIFSVDVDNEALKICAETGLNTQQIKSSAYPPLQIADHSIDFVFSHSVFSHLSEDCHRAWRNEFARILAPGGVAVITTRDRSIVEYWARVRAKGNIPFYALGAASSFMDTKNSLVRFDNGEFLFDSPHKQGITAGFFGEAVVPRQWAIREWSLGFNAAAFMTAQEAGCGQALIIAKK